MGSRERAPFRGRMADNTKASGRTESSTALESFERRMEISALESGAREFAFVGSTKVQTPQRNLCSCNQVLAAPQSGLHLFLFKFSYIMFSRSCCFLGRLRTGTAPMLI